MEKLCRIRDIQRAVNQFECAFEKKYGICLNEGMLLCSLLKAEPLSSGELGELLGLTSSNVSKVIGSVEKKGLILRDMSDGDRRKMLFSLTEKVRDIMSKIKFDEVNIPEILIKMVE